MDTILVTGGAGFIGYHLSKRLLKDGYNVVGYDNMNDYYDPKLKEDRVRDHEESGQDYLFKKGGFLQHPGSLPPLSGKASSFCIEFFDLRKSGKSSILGQ